MADTGIEIGRDVEGTTRRPVAAVAPTLSAIARFRPLDARAIELGDGFWAERRRVNRERTIPHGFSQLERAGNLSNLRLAAGAKGR